MQKRNKGILLRRHTPTTYGFYLLINYNTWTPRRTRKREEMETFKFLISIFIKFGERWRSSNEKWRPEKMFEQFSIVTFNKQKFEHSVGEEEAEEGWRG